MEYGKCTGHQDKGFLFQDGLYLMKWISLIWPKYIISMDLHQVLVLTHTSTVFMEQG